MTPTMHKSEVKEKKDGRIQQASPIDVKLEDNKDTSEPVIKTLLEVEKLFKTYLSKIDTSANLSLPSCLNLVEAILDTPVLVQKHGIRLAFECFDIANLKNLITTVWDKHIDISLRAVIYEALFKKVQVNKNVELFEVLKKFTTELNEYDDDEILNLLISESLADEFLGDFIESAWNAVSKFECKDRSIQRWKKEIVERIRNKLPLMREVFVKDFVIQIIYELFEENKIKILFKTCDVLNEVYEAKWSLVKAFLIHASSNSKTLLEYVHLTTRITQACIESWNEIYDDEEGEIYQVLCFDFIIGLQNESLKQQNCNPIDSVPIFEAILNEFKLKLPFPEVYIEIWKLNLIIIYNKVTQDKPIGEDTCVHYAREVGKFLIEEVNEGNYLTHMACDLSWAMRCQVKDLCIQLRNSGLSMNCDFDMSYVNFASGLTDFESVETYVLAAMILPDSHWCYEWDSFKEVISKISQMKDPSVQCAMHWKLRQKYEVPRYH